MFIPDIVGTPAFHGTNAVTTSVGLTLFAVSYSAQPTIANVINAAAPNEYGYNSLQWGSGTPATIGNGTKVAIVQQFIIQTPIKGNSVGVEVNGGLLINAPNCTITPIFGRLENGQATLLGPVTFLEHPTMIGKSYNLGTAETDPVQAWNYQERVVAILDDPGGVYAHGFLLTNLSGSTVNVSAFLAQMSERQRMDQDSVSYQNTRR